MSSSFKVQTYKNNKTIKVSTFKNQDVTCNHYYFYLAASKPSAIIYYSA